ncbi:hypothetical protein LSH36_187g00028 [Paralvinella palmiformis]|uniref:Profilin n=1 Tax=Paralvinella palmiformis TaxID=53620 RepID=A0AAD9JSZ0_9ANNE|nr:hypothetical protein LSH36_187g00028 [Paralvinella palmiformis]
MAAVQRLKHEDNVPTKLDKSLIDDYWLSFIDDLLSSGNVSEAVLYNLMTGDILAASPQSFRLFADEYEHIVTSFNKPIVFRRSGFKVNGCGYKLHMADGRMGLMGKIGMPARGCSVCKTLSLLVVATHDETMSASKCNDVIMNMGDFFRRKGM